MAEVLTSYVDHDIHGTTQTQPLESPSMDQENTTLSDPSSSSNSTILTGDLNHQARSTTSSQSTESPAEQAKFISADTSIPLSPMSRKVKEIEEEQEPLQSPSSSYAPASSQPADSPTEQVNYFSTNGARDSDEIVSSQAPLPQSPTSASSPRPLKTRTRSTSSGVLARLTNRSSSYISDYIVPGSPTSSHVSGDSPSKPKLDRAALAKPRGKYKSGVNWDSSPMNLAAGQEPFMEQASPPVEKTMEEIEASLKAAEMEQMAAAGSTKAAIAWSRANSFGDPIFATHRRAMAEASAKALQAATAGQSPPLMNGSLRVKSTMSRSPTDGGRLSNVRFNSGEVNEIYEDASSRNESISREGSQSVNSQDIITTGGQIVLDSARKAAADSVDAQVVRNPEQQMSISTQSPPGGHVNTEDAQAKSKLAKRKTFLGFGGKKEKKKGKGKDQKSGSEGTTDAIPEGESTPEPTNEQSNREEISRPASINRDANGTASRRRRFNDTRQLNLLANELAAEAMMGAPDSYPSLMPETRRASMMSLLAANNGDMGASPSNTSQISLQPGGLLSMPQPAFVNNEFGGRSGSPAGGSSRSGSPRFGAADMPRFDPPRAPFARSQQSLSTPSSPLASQKAKLTGVPADMLTGLGDGPYPTLPPRGLELSDSYMIPIAPLEGQATITHDQSSQGRNSLPDVFTRSRGASASSAPLPKRSVLQMSMHNPEAELQGLTKMPKASRVSPFGSRAPSKQVTPKSSFVNLRDKANTSVSPTLLSQELAKSSLSEAEATVSPEPISSSNEADFLEGQSKTESKEDDKVSKDPKKSFFRMRSKSKSRVAGTSDAQSNIHLLPPVMPSSTSKAQSLHSKGSDKQYKGSNNGSIHNQQLRAASHSAHSLVIVPSPTHSNTTASASSHDPGAFAYSSDGGSHQQGLSTATTPEALPAKMELSALSTNNNSDATRPLTPSPNERLAPSDRRPSMSPLGANETPNQHNRASPIPSTPRSTSATSKSSTTGSTLGKINKFKSMFASSKAPISKASPTPLLPPPQSASQVTSAPFTHHATNIYPSNGMNEKVNSRVNLQMANGQQRMASENTLPKERTTFKNFQAKIQEKMII